MASPKDYMGGKNGILKQAEKSNRTKMLFFYSIKTDLRKKI